jgi:hypothetical protein
MKNKALIGGVIALVILVLIAFFCIWLGKKVFDDTPAPGRTNTNRQAAPPRNLPPESPEKPSSLPRFGKSERAPITREIRTII